MILNNLSYSIGPGAIGLLVSAVLWVASIIIVLANRSGIQRIGAGIVFIGVAILVVHNRVILSLSLLAFGLFVHGCGRLLIDRKRR
ncbi:MAG: hypothetical protein AB1656_13030 [Candidatus Omnitrophota bacterium]